MTALLAIEDVSVRLPASGAILSSFVPGPAASFNILEGITLSVARGETFGLVGESGSGKTTLARAILGLTPVSAGRMMFEDQELGTRQSFAALRKKSAMMFQDAVASLSPRLTIGSLITEPFVIHGLAMNNRKEKATELLDRVGLPAEMASRYPHELSGGQARRVGVARALALNPALVIADEPTAGLDVSVQGEILNLMSGLKSRLGLSYLIISHNLALLRVITDRIAVMYLGRLVEAGPTRQVFTQPLHPYTKSLIAAEPQPDPRKRRSDLAIKGEIPSILARPRACEFHTRCGFARDVCRREAPQLREVEAGRRVRCHLAEELKA